MKNYFKPEDFENNGGLEEFSDREIAADFANQKLNELNESWPETLGFDFEGGFVTLDKEDFLNVIDKKIKFVNGRPSFNENGKTIYLYRHILNAADGLVVDHVNGNPLDNRKANLRICTQTENCYNSAKRSGAKSKYKGVSIRDEAKPFRARITKDGKGCHIGSFETEIEAALAYDVKAKEMFGEFARLNFGLAFVEPIVKEPCKHEPTWTNGGIELLEKCKHCGIKLIATWSEKV
jgi:HNH endonuclease/AP2 domain